MMKNLIRLEELLMLGLAISLFSFLDYAWWWFLVLFLAPDLGMIGYLGGPRVGAFCYNLVHHKGVAIAIYILGGYLASPPLQLAGVIMFGHSSMDRIFGYGLKYSESFHHTHLGTIGQAVDR